MYIIVCIAAIWLLPKDEVYGQWPRSGEIDIMESRGESNIFELFILYDFQLTQTINKWSKRDYKYFFRNYLKTTLACIRLVTDVYTF